MLLDQELQISPAEWQMWKNLPTTQLIVSILNNERMAWSELMVRGRTLERDGSEVKDTAHAVGVIEGIDIFLAGLEQELQVQWEEAAERKKEMEEREDES